MRRRLNIALIGAGRIGQVHAATIANRVVTARLCGVYDPVLSAAKSMADRLGISKVAPSADAIFQDDVVDAVLICTPTDTHASLIIAAAKAGKHIFCEKPVALDLATTDAAIAAAKLAGVHFQIGFNRRWDSNYARVRAAIAGGEIGSLRTLHITSRDSGPPPISYIKTSGGIFLDMTIHDWDMFRFLSGSEIEQVYVQGGVMVDAAIGTAGDIDTHITLVRFESGTLGVVENCRQAGYGYDQRVEAFGSLGAIQTENNRPNSAVISTVDGVRHALPHHFFMTRYTDAYASEIEGFVDSVIQGKPVAVGGDDGRRALAVGLAAKLSYTEQRPVRVSEVG